MEQKHKIIRSGQEITLYKCNPELNGDCDKKYCAHNKNALEKLCSDTTNINYALKIGQKAEEKEYTPGLKN